MAGCGCEMEARNEQERRTLRIVLGINALMFVFEIVLGWLAQSTGLIADSLDMLADALVYAISLYAVGRADALKDRAATLSGVLQMGLAVLVLADVLRRFIYGSEPVSMLMMSVGAVALVANSICLMLIAKHRDGGVHMRASLIFSANDVIANLGVIVSGGLVWLLGSRFPDLAIGFIIAGLVLYGGIRILREVAAHRKTPACCSK
ncbi:MAG: cation transporter [Sideroxydans sp.]|nr:cation transporter [Sideroxydans sp.]